MRGWSSAIAAALLLCSGPLRAERPAQISLNPHGEAGILSLPRAAVLRPGHLGFSSWFGYLHNDDDDAFQASPLSAGMGLPYNLDLALAVVSAARIDPERRSKEVQLHTTVKRRLWTPADGLITLSAGLRLENLFSAPDLTPLLLADMVLGRFTVVAAGGYRFATDPADSFSGAWVGLGVERALTDRLLWQLEATGRFATGARGSALGGGGVLRFRLISRLVLAAGVSVERHDQGWMIRARLGLTYLPTGSGAADSDGDGISDAQDYCPEEPEDHDGVEDRDGCPEAGESGQRRDRGLHRGPVQLRLKIPRQRVPVWVMERADASEDQSSSAAGGPRSGDGGRAVAAEQPAVGELVGDWLPLLLPAWLTPAELDTIGRSFGVRIKLHLPAWVEAPGR